MTSWIVKREIAWQITWPCLRFIRKTFKFIAQTPKTHWQQLEYKLIYLTFEYLYTCICLFNLTINLNNNGLTVSQHKLPHFLIQTLTLIPDIGTANYSTILHNILLHGAADKTTMRQLVSGECYSSSNACLVDTTTSKKVRGYVEYTSRRQFWNNLHSGRWCLYFTRFSFFSIRLNEVYVTGYHVQMFSYPSI